MSDQSKHIDLSNGLTDDVMLAYLHEELSNPDRHLVEKYLLDHPFEAEAMEGLQAFSTHVTDDVIQSNQQIDKRIAEDKKNAVVFWNRPLQIAAAVTVLIVGSWLIFGLLDAGLDSQTIVMEQEDDSDANVDPAVANKVAPSKSVTTDSVAPAIEKRSIDAPAADLGREPVFKKTESPKANKVIAETELEIVAVVEPLDQVSVDFEKIAIADEEENEDQLETDEIVETKSVALARSTKVAEDMIPVGDADEIIIRNPSSAPVSDAFAGSVGGVAVNKKRKQRRSKESIITPESQEDTTYRLLSGVVYNEFGDPMPDVTVTMKGASYGVVTDIDGKYKLQTVSHEDILLISFIGYKTVTLPIKDTIKLDVKLEPNMVALEEVVVGYGQQNATPQNYESPRPQNGYEEFKRYLKNELRYPEEAKANGITGKVILQFEITTSGTIINMKVIKSLGYGCDNEAIRLVEEGSFWSPAKRDGEVVSDQVKVKIKFE